MMMKIIVFLQIIDDNGTSCRKKRSKNQSSASASVGELASTQKAGSLDLHCTTVEYRV